eukprot:GHVR01104546.1.p1 GENE.GHVR01104546.1~~GHVR01104546.1.p1  ORF type:complete len:122 (+),score=17.16 GHVR01104546.1:298-663(+)
MEITFDNAPPRRLRTTSMPGLSTSSLLSRIEKPSLAERLGGGGDHKQSQGGSGPIRTRGASRPKAPAPQKPKVPRPARAQPKTAEELDKELDFFMGDDKTTAGKESAPEVLVASVEDIEMA